MANTPASVRVDKRGNVHIAKKNRIRKHKYSGAEAVLNCLKIVCEQRHKVSDLVDLIVLKGKILAVVKHTASQIGFHSDSRACSYVRL